MPILGVNIDHVATVRQARRTHEPDPVRAAHEAELGGAGCITAHLREDRRHVNDRDVQLLARTVSVKFNLEMAATDEMLRIALDLRPLMVTLVPEGRQEVTTEGGLPVAGNVERFRGLVESLREAGITASAFIDPDREQVGAAADAGFSACEIHTGPYANAFRAHGGDLSAEALSLELSRVREAAGEIAHRDLRLNVGHGLNYVNVGPIAALPGLWELHIGHSIVSRAVYVGMREAVREMVSTIHRAQTGKDTR